MNFINETRPGDRFLFVLLIYLQHLQEHCHSHTCTACLPITDQICKFQNRCVTKCLSKSWRFLRIKKFKFFFWKLAKKITTKFFFYILKYIFLNFILFVTFFSHITLFSISKKLLHIIRNKIKNNHDN